MKTLNILSAIAAVSFTLYLHATAQPVELSQQTTTHAFLPYHSQVIAFAKGENIKKATTIPVYIAPFSADNFALAGTIDADNMEMPAEQISMHTMDLLKFNADRFVVSGNAQVDDYDLPVDEQISKLLKFDATVFIGKSPVDSDTLEMPL